MSKIRVKCCLRPCLELESKKLFFQLFPCCKLVLVRPLKTLFTKGETANVLSIIENFNCVCLDTFSKSSAAEFMYVGNGLKIQIQIQIQIHTHTRTRIKLQTSTQFISNPQINFFLYCCNIMGLSNFTDQIRH